MHLSDNSLLSVDQEPLIVTATTDVQAEQVTGSATARSGIWEEHIQLAIDCLEAGATIVHMRVRDPITGRSTFQTGHYSAFIARVRREVPALLIQLDGSTRLEQPDRARRAQWQGVDLRHGLAELEPKPDFITIHVSSADAGSSGTDARELADNDAFIADQLGRLRQNDIQPFFLLRDIQALAVLERLVRSGSHMGPLNHCMVMATGQHVRNNLLDWMEYLRRAPDGSTVAFQGSTPIASPLIAMIVAFGLHIRVSPGTSAQGAGAHLLLVEQIKQVIRIARELGRTVATRDDTRRVMKSGIWFDSIEETLFMLGLRPSRRR